MAKKSKHTKSKKSKRYESSSEDSYTDEESYSSEEESYSSEEESEEPPPRHKSKKSKHKSSQRNKEQKNKRHRSHGGSGGDVEYTMKGVRRHGGEHGGPDTTIYAQFKPQTINVMKLIGFFFTDIFCNILYTKAFNLTKHPQNTNTLTENYKLLCRQYAKMFHGELDTQLYQKTIFNLHETYNDWFDTNYNLTETIDIIISEFVPREYFVKFSTKQKGDLLHGTLKRVIDNFVVYIYKEKLHIILSQNRKQHGPGELQSLIDVMAIDLLDIRENIHMDFVNPDRKKNSQHQEMNVKLMAALKEQIALTTKQKKEVAKRNKIIQQLSEKMKEMKVEREELYKRLAKYQVESVDSTADKVDNKIKKKINKIENKKRKKIQEQNAAVDDEIIDALENLEQNENGDHEDQGDHRLPGVENVIDDEVATADDESGEVEETEDEVEGSEDYDIDDPEEPNSSEDSGDSGEEVSEEDSETMNDYLKSFG